MRLWLATRWLRFRFGGNDLCVDARVGDVAGCEWRAQDLIDAERFKRLCVLLVEREPKQPQPEGAQPRGRAGVQRRQLGGEQDGVGMAAFGEREQLACVGGAPDNRYRVFGAEELFFYLAFGERRYA